MCGQIAKHKCNSNHNGWIIFILFKGGQKHFRVLSLDHLLGAFEIDWYFWKEAGNIQYQLFVTFKSHIAEYLTEFGQDFAMQ